MTDNRPLVAHVVYRFDTGGIENGMCNLFNHMPPEHYRHAVICLTEYTDFRQRITAQHVDFYSLHKKPGKDIGLNWRLFKLLRQLKPDILHTRNLAANECHVVGALAGVRGRIHAEHGRDIFDLHGKNKRYNQLRRLLRPFIHHYIAVSQDLRDWLISDIGVAPERAHQFYDGVDSVRFHPRTGEDRPAGLPGGFADADSIVIGSVGRMAPVKNFPYLTRAFIELVRRSPAGPRLRLVILGNGDVRAECQQLIDAAGLGQQAWFPGTRNDIAELMRAMDIFVLPSLGEGISLTIQEAMATGLPVVCTAVGGNGELVRPGVNGALVPSGDIEGMVNGLNAYVDNPALRREHGGNARARCEREFTFSGWVEGYERLYRQVLSSHR